MLLSVHLSIHRVVQCFFHIKLIWFSCARACVCLLLPTFSTCLEDACLYVPDIVDCHRWESSLSMCCNEWSLCHHLLAFASFCHCFNDINSYVLIDLVIGHSPWPVTCQSHLQTFKGVAGNFGGRERLQPGIIYERGSPTFPNQKRDRCSDAARLYHFYPF